MSPVCGFHLRVATFLQAVRFASFPRVRVLFTRVYPENTVHGHFAFSFSKL